jgi:ribosomal protein L18
LLLHQEKRSLSLDKELNVEVAKAVGKLVAEKALKAGIEL